MHCYQNGGVYPTEFEGISCDDTSILDCLKLVEGILEYLCFGSA
jgi:hypothetical protein